MPADSATACPISMVLMSVPELSGFSEIAELACAAVYPSPMAAPMAPIPMAIPLPVYAAAFTMDSISNIIYFTCTEI